MTRAGAAVVALVLLSVAGCTLRYGRVEPPSGSSSDERLATAHPEVAHFDTEFLSLHGPPGTKPRRLRTTTWYPIGVDGPLPVVVFSHGFLSDRLGGAYLAEDLASHGYVVTAADHPGTTRSAAGRPDALDVANQAGDVGALLDQLGGGRSPLAGRIDLGRVAIVGHSLGGLTAVLAGFHPRLHDPRIRAVVSIAGPVAVFTPAFFAGRDLPFLMIGASEDTIIDYATNAAIVTDLDPDAELLTIETGSHAGFDDAVSGPLRLLSNPDGAGCVAIGWYIDAIEAGDLAERLGGPADGVALAESPRPCDQSTPSDAMDPSRQRLITMLAVTAFVDAHLSTDPNVRRAAADYLRRGLHRDFPEAVYGAPPHAPS